MKFGVITFPGSNCDYDTYMAIKEGLNQPVNFIWHKDSELSDYDCIFLPGGFSYGDYLRTGSIARFSPVMKAVIKYAASGGLVVGICNGFQILLEAGLLPGAMLRNKSLRFRCKQVYLSCENNGTPFTNRIPEDEVLKIPIAHTDGNYYNYQAEIEDLKNNAQVIFRYCNADGEITDDANPNGSIDNIAGISNKQGNVLGMMPHPERAVEMLLGSNSGLQIFQSILSYCKSGVLA